MLVTGKTAESEVAEHVYDLILELHSIDSSVLLSVLPQLEFKLRVSIHVHVGHCLNPTVGQAFVTYYHSVQGFIWGGALGYPP